MNIGGFSLVEAFARHRVAPNILMLILVIVGVWALSQLNVRFFPRFDIQVIVVSAPWSGAAAEDVEKSLVNILENELRNVPNLSKMTSLSRDGSGRVYLEFPEKVNLDEAADEVKQYVDQALGALPSDADTPNVTKIVQYDGLLRLAIVGDSIEELRRLARRYESELSSLGVAKVDVNGLPKEEIRVMINRERLLELNTTVREVGDAIARQNRDDSAGDVEVGNSQQRLRALAKSEDLFGLTEVPLSAGGGVLRLGDIADIAREQADGEKSQLFDGQTAVELQLRRRAQDSTLESAAQIYEWVEEKRAELPPGVNIVIHDERWKLVQSRLSLLVKNGWQGLILVLLVLFLFLNGRVAFWVAMGIPAVFLGTLFIMQLTGGSINMISMFALIMATGIIVDDAIVVGENAMYEFEQGKQPLDAAVSGARAMVVPVVASTFTTISSFLPLFVVSGIIGSIIYDIPFVIVCILLAALFECFFILPGHLYHAFGSMRETKTGSMRQKLEKGFIRFQEKIFRPLAAASIHYRAVTVAFCLSMVILSVSLFAGGLVNFRFFPGGELSTLQADVSFISGTPKAKVQRYVDDLLAALRLAEAEFDEENIVKHVSVRYGSGGTRDLPLTGDEYARVRVELSSSETRQTSGRQVSSTWEKFAPEDPELELLNMRGERAGPPGEDLEVEFSGNDIEALKAASLEAQELFLGTPGVSQPFDDTPYGKSQITFELNPLGRALGLNVREVAAQLRDALDGYKAQTFYEGVDEIEVRILQEGADNGGNLSSFQVRLPDGGFAALEDIADLRSRRGFDTITRVDGRLVIKVAGKVDFTTVSDLQGLIRSFEQYEVREIAARHGVDFSFEGQQADQRKTIEDMKTGLIMALLFIYIILAWVFSSWSMPLVVMLTMPLGVIGAVLGHWIMGVDMSILSFFGVFALMGIIVNDSIVLVRYFQELRQRDPTGEVDNLIIDTACRRLRAVLVTSLTTIGGLLPLMFEKSTQAQFLIPMAISICFGLAFATILILLFTPACLSYHQSAKKLLSGLSQRFVVSGKGV
ncbi:MAG: efflux RND transporter permease subunit [Gammaproteobacteria bacterium WSBS_2016_MAG_OTU1]